MAWQILRQEQRASGLYVSARFWESAAAMTVGKPSILQNDFVFPHITARHQRIRVGPNGGLLHHSGAEVLADEVQEFLGTDGCQWERAPGERPTKDRRGRWVGRRGVAMHPFRFERAVAPRLGSQLRQELDPQWERELFFVAVADNVARHLTAYDQRARMREWRGDRRGTTTVLQVASSGDDGYTTIAFGTPTGFASTASNVRSGGTVDSSDERYDAWYFFSGLSGVSGTVNAAVLSLYGRTAPLTGSPYTKLKVENSNVATPPSDGDDHQSRTRHANYVQWNSPSLSNSAFVDSPDITTLVQPIVDLGEASTILLLNDGEQTDYGYYDAYSYDLDSSKAAMLTIDHGSSGGSGPGGQPALLNTCGGMRRPIYRR